MHAFPKVQRPALDDAVEAVTYSRVASLKRFHIWVTSLDLIFDRRPKTGLKVLHKPGSNMTHESPENPLDPRFARFFRSFIIQKIIQSQHCTVQLGCHGNLGMTDALAFCCRLGLALVFILPPFHRASNTSSGHVKHARSSPTARLFKKTWLIFKHCLACVCLPWFLILLAQFGGNCSLKFKEIIIGNSTLARSSREDPSKYLSGERGLCSTRTNTKTTLTNTSLIVFTFNCHIHECLQRKRK